MGPSRFVPVLGLAAILAGCGGGKPTLEQALRGHGNRTEVCDGSCRRLHVTAVSCEARATADGFRLCRVTFDHGKLHERICAKLRGSAVAARPLRHCS